MSQSRQPPASKLGGPDAAGRADALLPPPRAGAEELAPCPARPLLLPARRPPATAPRPRRYERVRALGVLARGRSEFTHRHSYAVASRAT